eukprot:TRINITY_DN5684_c0_g1_i1.p1 TRINITY_DN5684_c0_g1~~TRINITY_DN5684_c0_g1_i1.p1  ORF type:complete len:839 (-),score=145.56 TRINITY_DN5684_c0_g1_i1:185-2668(-)
MADPASARQWQPCQEDYRNLTELLAVYFPFADAETPEAPGSGDRPRRPAPSAQGNIMSRQEANESLRWCFAFCNAALTAGVDSPAAIQTRRALEVGRGRFSSTELRSLRPAAAGPEAGSSGEDPVARLSSQAERFLAEVSLGLHLAALAMNRQSASVPRPPATPQGLGVAASARAAESASVRIDVEVVAPELEKAIEGVRSDLIDRYVGLRGSVVRAANIAPLITDLNFTCSRCGTEVTQRAIEGRFDYPSSCPKKCRFARFSVNRDRCKAIDWQRVRLQEDFAELASSAGPQRRMPRTVDCDLKRALVGACVPGDSVTVYGIIRCMPTSGPMSGSGEARQAPARSLYVLYLEVKAVVNNRRSDTTAGAASSEEDFTPLQLSFIREIHQEVERFPILVASFCQHIYGQSLVKAALLLAVLGGLPLRAEGMDRQLRRRGDAHVLLLGDPGLGKSELLRALARLSSRGVYISGNSSSTAGLTASVVRDPSGEFALEAGALILADNGLCCIDEFDKMGSDQHALLEAMEQQTVSIAKAGIVCTLPARTTVVTAANPSKGSWDVSLTLAENLKGVMSEALLSRFDVIFLMRNEDDQQHDSALSRHIVNRRMPGAASAGTGNLVPAAIEDWSNSKEHESSRASLKARLAKVNADNALPTELLQTYLRYAKRYAQPSMSKGARRRIKDFYLEKRSGAHRCSGSLPVTPRQLEALIRLSEARAKAELRRVVLVSDVEDVIEILQSGSDFQEKFTTTNIRKGRTPAGKLVERLQQHMERVVQAGGSRTFREEELKQYVGRGVESKDWAKAINALNNPGALTINQNGTYTFNPGML